MNIKNFPLWIIVVAIIAIALVVFIYWQFTLNFGALEIFFLLAIIVLPVSYHLVCYKDVQNTQKSTLSIGKFDNQYGVMGAALLLLLGALCVKTLNNYFYADKHVYRNIDHHAVHFSGISIAHPEGFVLADHSRNAFFDNDHNNGQAVITDVNDTAVVVHLRGFSRPIFFNQINSAKRCYRQDLANAASLLSFKENDHLLLRMRNDDVYDFRIGEVTQDSVDYWLRLPNGNEIKCEEDRFLIHGLPLNKLTRHPQVQDANFTGIHIVRDVIKPLVKKKEKLKDYRDTRYCVEIQHVQHKAEDNYVVAVKVVEGNNEGGEWHHITEPTDATIQIPYETTFVIGYDGSSSRPAYFTRNHPMAQGRLALLYRLPIYHYFEQTPDKSFNNVCVTTSLGSYMDNIDAMPENIMLFDAFHHMDNINNMAPMTVSYVSGSTDQLMEFLYTTADNQQHTTHAGECFVGTEAPNHEGVTWIAGVEDLKQTSPFQPQAIKWYIILFTLVLAILLFVGTHSVNDEFAAERNTFTTIEFVAYAVTLYLVSFRWFLLWRTSVFLPVENINYYEFHGLFRNIDNHTKFLWTMVGFVIIVLVAKILIRYKPAWTNLSLPAFMSHFWQRWNVFIQVGLTLILLGICAVYRHSSPWFVITCPVLLYILNTIIITKRFGFYRKDDRGRVDEHDSNETQNHSEPPIRLFAWSLGNALLTSVVLLYIDSGFGILFFTFTLFWLSWLLHEHVTHYLPNETDMLRNWVVLFIFVVMLLLVGYYKEVIRMMFYHVWLVAGVMGMIGALISLGVFYILKWGKKSVRIWCCVSLTVLFALSSPFFHWYVSTQAKHTAQRIVVHFDQPEVVMKNIEDEQTEHRFLQAALNHMIIGEYSRRGEQVKLFGEHGYGYFKMQPHSRVGALWNAQLTDISLVRFVIAEHSPMLPFLIILFFLFMLVWAVAQPLYKRWTRAVLIQIPLLLMVQSLLIWMATTQRFIFLGQDFPMVSINSRLTLFYFFSLISIWVITAIYSKVTFCEVYDDGINKDKDDDLGYTRNNFRYEIAYNEMRLIFIVMCACAFLGFKAPRGESSPTLRMTTLMEQFCKKVEQVNARLKDYQNERFRRGSYTGSLSNLASFMHEFNQQEHIDSLFVDFPFGYRIWTRYVNNDSRFNNTHQVLHACLDGHHQLQLKTVNVFYNHELPRPKENEWRGNIVAISDTAGITRNSIVEDGLCAYRLPANWLTDGEEKTIVSSIGSYIDGSEPDFVMRKGIRSAAIMGRGITIRNKETMNRLRPVVQEKRYWARNVMLNGHRTMFYPMGSSLFWMSQFAEELRIQRNLVGEKARGNDYNADVELTLIPDLNTDLYNILSREGATRSSVIVANGDGAVWALPNYDRDYQLNPNDYKQIANILDSLDLYGLQGSSVARRIFGNQNLEHLPYGPGSSQKPLVWTAVASQVEYPHWNSLRIERYLNGWIESEGGSFKITHFNGMEFTRPFRPLRFPDENRGEIVTLRGYMTNSSNVYNAIMAYIGSFCESDLEGNGLNTASDYDGQSLFARWNGPITKDNYVRRFPIMSINGRTPFTLNRKIVSEDQPNSILNRSMHEMFFRSQGDDELFQSRYANPAYGLLLSDESNRHMGFAFLERSKFDSRQGAGEGELMENAIRVTAIGAEKVWYVTPWKMAEAYGRMASLNRNLHLNIVRQKNSPVYESFARLTNGYWHARSEQMKGMSDVLTNGTGSSLRSKLGIIPGGDRTSNHVGDYYLYAKTGTIGPPNSTINHHRLGVIISDTDLVTATEDDLKMARYVMIYFAFSETGKWQAYADVILRVMASTEFNQYMKQ